MYSYKKKITTDKKKYALNLKKFLFLISFFLPGWLIAGPTIERISLRTAMSPRVEDDSWTELRAVLRNPDKTDAELSLRLVSDANFFSPRRNVFVCDVLVPAESELSYLTEVVSDNSDSYRVELYQKGNRIAVSDNTLVSRIAGGRAIRTLAVMSDTDDISLGSIALMPEYKDRLFQNLISKGFYPQHYAVLSSFDCIVLLRPDFGKMTEKNFKAIIDYVINGGRLVFADPNGIMDAAMTPLAPLLPVKPLSIRKTNDSKSLKKAFASFSPWSARGNYVDFLESFPRGEGADILKEGNFPLFRVKKYGAGTVMTSSYLLTENNFKESGIWPDLVKLAYVHEKENLSYRKTVELLDGLIGFAVPSPGAIRKILFIVLIPAMLILLAGVLSRKGSIAWSALAIFAVLMTFYIFSAAGRQGSENQRILSASVEKFLSEDYSAVSNDKCAVFSKNDTSIDIKAKDVNCLFSAIPPENKMLFLANNPSRKEAFDTPVVPMIIDPMQIDKTKEGVAKIAKLQIKSNSSKQFQMLGSFYGEKKASATRPEIIYSDKGYVFGGYNAPDLKFENAGILFPAGVLSLKIENGKILPSTGKEFRSDDLSSNIFNSLRSEIVVNHPLLALVSKTSDIEYFSGLEGIRGNHAKVLIMPLAEKFTGTRIKIPFEMTKIMSADNTTRTIRSCRNFSMFSQDDTEYRFKFSIPSIFSMIKPERIEIKLKYVNDGGNVNIVPRIAGKVLNTHAAGKKNAATPEFSGIISHSEKNGNIYVFSGDKLSDVIDSSGAGTVIISATLKNKSLPIEQKIGSNQWTVLYFAVSVFGEVKGDISGMDY
jgi:hypothetical protein